MEDAEIYQKQGAVGEPDSICVPLDAGCPLYQNQLLILLQRCLRSFSLRWRAYVPAQSWADGLFPNSKDGDCPVISIQFSVFLVRLFEQLLITGWWAELLQIQVVA